MGRENTSETKLQYVHFVRQKGTEIYRPRAILIDYPTPVLPAGFFCNRSARSYI